MYYIQDAREASEIGSLMIVAVLIDFSFGKNAKTWHNTITSKQSN